MNKVILTGRITKDLELRSTSNGKAVVEFTLATNRPINRDGEKQADFINCVVYGVQAENLAKYQSKGSLIAVFGEMRVDQWQNEQGENRYKTYVLVSNIEYLGNKKEENAQNNQNIEQKDETNPFADFGTENNTGLIDDDSLPF